MILPLFALWAHSEARPAALTVRSIAGLALARRSRREEAGDHGKEEGQEGEGQEGQELKLGGEARGL